MSENFTPNFSTDSFATSRNSSRERYAADPTKMSSAAWKQFPDLESVADLEPEKSSQENPPSQDLEGSELHTDTEVSPHSSNHSIRSSENTFCDLVVRNYVIAFLLALGGELFPVILSAGLFLYGYDLLPIDFREIPMSIKTDKTFLRYVAYKSMEYSERIIPHEIVITQRSWQSKPMNYLEVIYHSSNVLTKERLKAIDEIEKMLTNFTGWSTVCLTDQSGNCLKPMSLIRYFDGSINPDLKDPEFTNIPSILYNATTNSTLKEDFEKLIANDASVTLLDAESTLTRSVFYIGTVPVSGDDIIHLWRDNFVDKLEVLKEGKEGMKIYYFNDKLLFDDLMKQVNTDLVFAVASFVFIVIFVYLQTQSVFITFFGIASIFTSFVWTNLVYRVVFGYKFFGIFHSLSIFIILGIGTDNLFVFNDTWRATEYMNLKTIKDRFSYCYSHASLTMLITSVTTAAAFACNILTPLYGISSFATFTALLVMVNYMSAIFFFPTCILIYHKHVESSTWTLCGRVKIPEIKALPQPNAFVLFFKGPIYRFLTHRVARWILIGCFTTNAIVFAFYASQLEISKKEVQYFIDDNNYEMATKFRLYGFRRTLVDTRIKVLIVFGVKEQDMSACIDTDYKCYGKLHFDDALDLNPIPAQLALMAACEKIKNLTGHQDLFLHRDEDTNYVSMSCFMQRMDMFFRSYTKEMNEQGYNLKLALPISGTKFIELMKLRKDLYHMDSNNFYRYFETAVSFWLNNAYRGSIKTGLNLTSDYAFSKYLGLARDSVDLRRIASFSKAMYGARLRYAIIEIETKLFKGRTNFRTAITAHDAWEQFTNDLMSHLPVTVQGFQTTRDSEWHYYKISQALEQSSARGIFIGLILALSTLVIATNNVIISTLATLNIMLVVGSFAGCIKFFGWSVSVIESINLSLVTGLAVDYVVHLSVSYHHSPQQERVQKVRDMLENMGVSVLSGAVTTTGAAFFMLGAKIYFFFQFGVFILVTIMFSLLYSIFWFTPLLSVIGPERNVGSLTPYYKWLWQKVVPCVDLWLSTTEASLPTSREVKHDSTQNVISETKSLDQNDEDTEVIKKQDKDENKSVDEHSEDKEVKKKRYRGEKRESDARSENDKIKKKRNNNETEIVDSYSDDKKGKKKKRETDYLKENPETKRLKKKGKKDEHEIFDEESKVSKKRGKTKHLDPDDKNKKDIKGKDKYNTEDREKKNIESTASTAAPKALQKIKK